MDYFYAIGNYEQVEKCATLMNVYGDLEPISMAGLIVSLWKQGKEEEAIANANQLWPLLDPDKLENHIWFNELVKIVEQTGKVSHAQNPTSA
jgi:hypothetical protein